MALGAIPAYALARKRLNSEPLGLLFGALYLVHPAHQWSVTYEFHPDTFATPLLVTAFYALEAKRWRLYAFAILLTALIKESAGMTIALLGIWACFKDRKAGIATICFGLAMLPVAMLTIQHFNGGVSSPYILLFKHYGSTPSQMVYRFLTHPAQFLHDLFPLKNFVLIGCLLIVFCFLPLFAPEMLLLSLPMILVNFLSNREEMHSYEGYYFDFATPFLLLGAIKGLQRVVKVNDFAYRMFILNLPIWACAGVMMGSLQRSGETVLYAGPPQEAIQECNLVVKMIPNEAAVSAVMALGPHLTNRVQLFQFPNPLIKRAYGGTVNDLAEVIENDETTLSQEQIHSIGTCNVALDYIAICPTGHLFPLSEKNFTTAVITLLQSRNYETEYVGNYLILLKKVEPGTATLKQFSDRIGMELTSQQQIKTGYLNWTKIQEARPKGAIQ